MTNCKNCKMTDEYCASGDCPNDTMTEQYKSINESLNKYVKANVELATWMLEKQNNELKELLKECQKYIETMYLGAKNYHLDSFSDIAYHNGIELLIKIDGVLNE